MSQIKPVARWGMAAVTAAGAAAMTLASEAQAQATLAPTDANGIASSRTTQ